MIQDQDLKTAATNSTASHPSQAGYSSPVLSSTLTLEGALISDGRITVAGTIEGVMAVTKPGTDQPVSDSCRFYATISGTLEGDEIRISGGGRFRARLNCTSIHFQDMA